MYFYVPLKLGQNQELDRMPLGNFAEILTHFWLHWEMGKNEEKTLPKGSYLWFGELVSCVLMICMQGNDAIEDKVRKV